MLKTKYPPELPKPKGKYVLIDPIYDPAQYGRIILPDQVKNPAPCMGEVVAVGPEQDEIEPGFRVLMSFYDWGNHKLWTHAQVDGTWHEYAFYRDEEVVAFVDLEGEVFPRRECVIVHPDWTDKPTKSAGGIDLLPRVFVDVAPQYGTVHRTGERVTMVKRGDIVLIPHSGGNELGVKNRVLYSIKESDIPGIITNAIETDTTVQHRGGGTPA